MERSGLATECPDLFDSDLKVQKILEAVGVLRHIGDFQITNTFPHSSFVS